MREIQWFPGHMLKTQKNIQTILPSIDLFIQILDARAPFSTRNPILHQLAKGKPKLYILNKKDLTESASLEKWLLFFKKETDCDCLSLSLKETREKEKLLSLVKAKIDALTRSTVTKKGRARVLIAGIPNIGKSSFINALLNKKVSQVAKKAGQTQSLQNYHFRSFTLIDTPGILWHKWDKLTGYKLALLGSISDRLLDFFSISQYAFSLLKDRCIDKYKKNLETFKADDFFIFITDLALKKGLILKGAEPDIDKTCFLFVKEIREGKWGPLVLESPENIQASCENLDLFPVS